MTTTEVVKETMMALEGSLQDMSLIDLFQIFRMGPKSGILLLNSGSEQGVIYVSEGQLVDAVVVSSTNRQVITMGEGAVLHMLEWEHAAFIFRADSEVSQRPVRILRDSESLVLEALRRRDQPSLMSPHQRITLETQLELAPIPGSIAGGLSLDLEQWRLLSQVSVSNNVRDLCDKTGMDAEKVIRLTTELVAIGLLDTIQPRASRATQPVSQPDAPLMGRSVGNNARTNATVAERGLLKAVMRRIRGL